jgi:hypothetical protein
MRSAALSEASVESRTQERGSCEPVRDSGNVRNDASHLDRPFPASRPRIFEMYPERCIGVRIDGIIAATPRKETA